MTCTFRTEVDSWGLVGTEVLDAGFKFDLTCEQVSMVRQAINNPFLRIQVRSFPQVCRLV